MWKRTGLHKVTTFTIIVAISLIEIDKRITVLLIRIRTFLPDPEPHLAIHNYLLLKKADPFVPIS
jgi:hypothetical protein